MSTTLNEFPYETSYFVRGEKYIIKHGLNQIGFHTRRRKDNSNIINKVLTTRQSNKINATKLTR